MLVLDRNGRVERFNRRCEAVSGYRFAEVQGRFLWDMVLPPEQAATVRAEAFDALLRQSDAASGSYTNDWVSRSGERRRIEWSNTVLRDAQGQVEHVVSVGIDTTERHRTEMQLRIKDAAIAASINAISIVGMDGRTTYVNQAYVDLWRLPDAAAALGRRPVEFCADPADAAAMMQGLQQHGHWQGEFRARLHDGGHADVQLSASLVRDDAGQPLCMLGSFIDVSTRHQMARALQRERDFATSLVDTAPCIILLLDPDGTIRHANPFFEHLSGYRLDEVKGRDWFDTFVPAPDRERARAQVLGALHELPIRRNIGALVTRSGSPRAIEWSDQTLRDESGQVSALLSIGLDVTEQLQQQEQTRLSEARLNEAQRIAKIGSWEHDLGNDSLVWTAAIHDLFEIDRTQFGASYEAFLNAIHPDDRERVNAAYTASLRNRTPYAITHRLRMADGRIKWVEERCQTDFDASGKPLVSRGTVQDVTEQHQLEEQLRQLNQTLEARVQERTAALQQEALRNQLILSTTTDGFFAADSRGRILDANPAFCAMLGYLRDELLQRTIMDIEAEENPAEVAAHVAQVLTQGHDRFDSRHRRKDGSVVEVEISVSRVQFGGEPMIYGFARDITRRRESEAALRRARDEAEAANAAKSEFLSRMSHELRTPLNAILGFGQLLQTDPDQPLTDTQLDRVGEMLQAGEHLLAMVNEVLDLARIESGRLEITLEPVALAPLIEACAAQIGPLAEQRAIALTLDLQAAAWVRADPVRLRQVLLNLLSNAVKYNHEGGSIRIGCAGAGDRLRISVHDSGPGIAEAALPRLFRPFERLESAYQGIEGTGIGLALVKRLVEAMHGHVGVHSVPGQGSSFWFELPLWAPAAAAGGRQRLLYIEDNPTNLRLVQAILARRPDVELFTASSGEAGLAIALRERPQLIMLDINLSGIDGFTVLRRLQEDASTRHIPVIAVSGNAMPHDIARGLAAGFVAYLAKPFEVAQFLQQIDRALPGRPEGDA